MHRRSFLQAAGILAVGTVAPLKTSGCGNHQRVKSIGIQLYTIRDIMNRDPDEGLALVASLGYDYVEGAGYEAGSMYKLSPWAFKGLLSKYNLTMPSGHFSWEWMYNDIDRVVETAVTLEHAYVVLPYWPEDKRTPEGYDMLLGILKTAGRACQREGLQFAYHHHAFEFDPLPDGKIPFDMILAETDPDLVKIELDHYWLAKAGKDYAAYFRQYPGRFPLWHVKDMDNTPEQFFAAVGNGVLDWPAIFRQSETAGLDYFFVEQDNTREHVLIEEQIASSFQYLRKMRF
ncbi:MAG: sugar phosphate isomerase/epimerase [Lewinella sp.]|nr:sugar phosphate isomerase/epimerase [Lewinella sp.]